MSGPIKLSKSDARRALVRHHFAPCNDLPAAFDRLRSVQFDPIAPVGCNHDLVLQARVPGYKIGAWAKLAYEDRLIYDGWDKMASLVPFEGWPLRRFIYDVQRRSFERKIFQDHKDAVEAILEEIEERGPLMPKECGFQQRREDWKGSWYGASVAKQTLRALWHSGLVMTAGRKNGQHLYDLTERVVPRHLLELPRLPDADAVLELTLERHRAMGMVRPSAAAEVWSYVLLYYDRKHTLPELVRRNAIVPVEVDGVRAHATPDFLSLLDRPALEPRVVFVAPLDQFMWDRKMIAHLFDFDYAWEIYTPEAKRRWGYYVLPVLFGDRLAARAEFWCRDGILELREWHWEESEPGADFWTALEVAAREFMDYCSAHRVSARAHVDRKAREVFEAGHFESGDRLPIPDPGSSK
ncbi:MAG TPA: crosslink repair DNA glycosylase YcaQ family protein [Fimbriimonadaceae bacterium]|nr:crosslink repair DNA glycosylase YcaQ family protein [Fimbriimonadaceae bacterium]